MTLRYLAREQAETKSSSMTLTAVGRSTKYLGNVIVDTDLAKDPVRDWKNASEITESMKFEEKHDNHEAEDDLETPISKIAAAKLIQSITIVYAGTRRSAPLYHQMAL